MAADLKVVLAALLREISERGSCDNLAEVKTILSATRAENIYNVSKDLDLSPLFNCLNSFSGDTLNELSELLGKLLDAFPPTALLAAHKQHFVAALGSSHDTLKAVILRQLIRCSKDNATLCQLARDHRILESILWLLGGEDLWSSKQSATLLKQMIREKEVLSAMLHPPVAHVLDSVMDHGDVCRFRVFEVFVDVAKASPDNLERLSESGHMERLLKEMDKNDVLVQLNALEVLTELVSCSHGLDYLERTGIISKLRLKALNISSDPLGNFLGPGVLKFFGSMGVTSPQRLLLDYPQVLGFIFESVQSDEPTYQVVAAETVGIISSTIQGKRVLQSHEDQMSRYLKTLRQRIESGKVDFKVRYLGALSNVLHIQDRSCEDLERLTEHWFGLLGQEPMKMLLSLCRQPFPELRCAALAVVAEVARTAWGQAMLSVQPGFLEYLLDRSTEADKQGKEAKFAIVACLAQAPPRGFAADDWQRIRTVYHEGPFYAAADAAVTFEGLS
ncbi:26S proteasome non-ATPase regulatory subunit 5 [Amblyomma americanum]|uniref:26S proteasome non-ATPase regulatory subunit 5 n=1 Tax=Amblyomma americanum TaxID=6943 RepID=A0AAQ4EAL3_AMBAM